MYILVTNEIKLDANLLYPEMISQTYNHLEV